MQTILKRALLLLGTGLAATAIAAPTTIDQAPAVAASSSAVLPNIEFILDDSGSMCWQVMPDDAAFGAGRGGAYPAAGGNCADAGPANFAAGSAKYGPYSKHCNGVYYDPSKTYALPIGPTGTPFTAATVGATRQDGFFAYTGAGFTNTTNVVQMLVAGTGAAAFPSPAATVGSNVILDVTACPAGMVQPNTGYYQTALMMYVTGEAPTFLGAHRIFGEYQSCAANKLTMKVTAVMGGAFSTARSNWSVAKIPGTYDYTGAEADTDFTYSATGTLDTTKTFYTQCNAKTNSTPALFTFTPVTDLQNHANWFSYYRSRINTMKTSMSLAFGGMLDPEKYRLGYTTITYSGTNNADDHYLDIANYATAAAAAAPTPANHGQQRIDFFNKIFKARAGGSTALRNALSKAGLIYAGKLLTGARDPVQHSCQKNNAILSTDGYWNAGSGWPAADVGGYRIPAGACAGNACYALTAVGNQDGPGLTDYPAYDPPHAPVAIDEPQVDRSAGAAAGTNNTLADVSMYYYKNKLRDGGLANCTSGSTGENLCPTTGTVPVSATDCNRFQHMNTFTIGLGVQGYLKGADNYLTGGSADYNAIVANTKQWPVPNNATTVDDLWHAAVNGRGGYYPAKDPAAIVSSLNKALSAISSQAGSGGAAAASSPQLAPGDSNAYLARYSPEGWWGDVLALALDPNTGALLSSPGDPASVCGTGVTGSPVWSAQKQLDLLQTATPTMSTRKIYMVVGGALGDFKSANLPSPPSPEFDPSTLTQYAAMSAAEKAQATKDHLVDYLRGVKSVNVPAIAPASAGLCCEDESGNNFRLFRDRSHVLGDIVGTEPQFVGKSILYGDAGHSTFSSTVTAARQRVVYAGANDGMLHAFDAGMPGTPPAAPTTGTGDELWAFVPTAVLPNLKKMADFTYNANHRYSVNGPMHVGDIDTGGGNWKTLLVGGLGAGGRDYYALDVTNPSSPVLAWEFSTKNPGHANNMGYTFGAPLITKVKGGAHNGKWVVLLPSGYNNESPGDQKGHLFMVDADTGVVLQDWTTGTTADSSLSGIAGLANWVDSTLVDNSTQHVYGGDLDGNLWRFDISSGAPPVKLAYFQKGGFRQPITHRPELGEAAFGSVKQRMIFVGTGKTLTAGDLDPTKPSSTATRLQSFYAVKDDLSTTFGGTPFSSVAGVVPLTLSGSATTRNLQYSPVAQAAPGWYFDFGVDAGEKMTSDVTLQVGWLTFATTAPSTAATACDASLNSFLYFVEYNPQATRNTSSSSWTEISSVGQSGAFGASVYQTASGNTVAAVTDDKGKFRIIENKDSSNSGIVRRVSWRELVK